MPDYTPKEVLDLIKSKGIRIIDIKFTDLLGTLQHFSLTNEEFGMGSFEGGLGFDGSSIRGFQNINESDMLLFPDPNTPGGSMPQNAPSPTLPEVQPRASHFVDGAPLEDSGGAPLATRGRRRGAH